jgi:hypothetical protein
MKRNPVFRGVFDAGDHVADTSRSDDAQGAYFKDTCVIRIELQHQIVTAHFTIQPASKIVLNALPFLVHDRLTKESQQ